MAMQIVLTKWRMADQGEGKGPIIAGTFEVRAGGKKVATQDFNDGYGAMNIALPTKLSVEAEALGEKIRTEIEKSFN